MKPNSRYLLLLFLLLALPSVSLTMAQEPAPTLDSLYVAFWPDYDQPDVLVLLTGTLAADATLPAEVTIPIPPDADINAVARIDSDLGMADVEYQVNGDSVTFLTPDEQFRLEFYVPYEDDGEWRTFDYVWNADLDVQELAAEIQQPLNAKSMTSQPAASNIIPNTSDGLTYHGLPTQSVPAGTPFEMSFRYNITSPGLTVGEPSLSEANTLPLSNSVVEPSSGNNWLLVLAGVGVFLVAVAGTWLVTTRINSNNNNRRSRKSRKPRKPSPKDRSTPAQFCHNCGVQAEKGDQFCRNCGTQLKHT